ncbi:hypothetical protein N8920_05610 [Opitutales bacterium]|nr:hypothetical protein [Opitutales bacterium]MDA8990398.1 hypothetical protein [Opitutales bacterium]
MTSQFRPKVPTPTDDSIFEKLKGESGWYEQAKIKGQRLIIADGIAYDDNGQEFEGDTKQTLGSVVNRLNHLYGESIYDVVYIDQGQNEGKVALIDIPSLDACYSHRHMVVKAFNPCAAGNEEQIKHDLFALPSIEQSNEGPKGEFWKAIKDIVDSGKDLPFCGVVLKNSEHRFDRSEEGNEKDRWWAVEL